MTDSDGKLVELASLLDKGPLVISFNRGPGAIIAGLSCMRSPAPIPRSSPPAATWFPSCRRPPNVRASFKRRAVGEKVEGEATENDEQGMVCAAHLLRALEQQQDRGERGQ
ncbi:MAG TPA: hypothetical protein VED02_06800 [Methyloceanibacter sp.]|nr:hypothetical protein [Methyloceanibacter sp.]